MIDINQIIGINLSAEDEAALWEIKIQVASVTQHLDADDLFLIGESCCRGSDEATGYMLNSKLCKHIPDFIKLIKVNFNAIGLTDVDCPKHVFIITYAIDDSLRREIIKMDNINHYRNYGCKLHLFGLDLPEEEVASSHSLIRIQHSNLKRLPSQLTEVFNG